MLYIIYIVFLVNLTKTYGTPLCIAGVYTVCSKDNGTALRTVFFVIEKMRKFDYDDIKRQQEK